MTRSWRRGGVAICVAGLVAACTGHHTAATPSPKPLPAPDIRLVDGVSCSNLHEVVPTAPVPTSSGSPAKQSQSALPALVLPCLTGAATILDLRTVVGRPTLITLWASWCGPCRKELPAFQRIADRGGVVVLGVNTEDDAKEAVAKLTQLHVTFPSVWDFPGRTLDALLKSQPIRKALPITIFMRADGTLAKVYQGSGFTDSTLTAAVQTYLGVAP